MSRSVIILGASARAAAFSAIAAGYEPYAIDLFADCDLATACPAVQIRDYPHGFLAALAAAPNAPWIYTGGLENYPRLIERLAKVRPLWGNRGPGLRLVRDPVRLAELARQAGLEFPETRPATRGSPPAVGDEPRQWLLKRKHSSGGLGVRFAEAADWPKPHRHHVWQRYVPGIAVSATFVACRCEAWLLGCSRQLTGKDAGYPDVPFLYAGSIGPLALASEQRVALADFANLLAAEGNLAGLIGVDFILGDDGRLWVLEVNPRYTASVEILERATAANYFALHAAACMGSALTPGSDPSRQTAVSPSGNLTGKQIVYARQHCTIPKTFERLVAELNRPGQPPGIADLPAIGARFTAGQPIATVFAKGQTEQTVLTDLQHLTNRLESLLTPEP